MQLIKLLKILSTKEYLIAKSNIYMKAHHRLIFEMRKQLTAWVEDRLQMVAKDFGRLRVMTAPLTFGCNICLYYSFLCINLADKCLYIKLVYRHNLSLVSPYFMLGITSFQGPSAIASQSFDKRSYFFDNPRRYDSDEDLTAGQSTRQK